ncbi:MAG TPA: nuclear transport factor 2 family protein [Planctomycetota bacterium]|nr:nuclear transport factor 2 family protein [Planctomycetota bacterium]
MDPVPPVLVRYIEGLKAHDVEAIAATVDASLVFTLPGRTLDKSRFLEMLRALYRAFPDWKYEHETPEVRGDRVRILWRQGGTHTGPFSLPGRDPIPATGRRVRIPEQSFRYRVLGDAIIEICPEAVAGGAPGGILDQIGGSGSQL